MKSEILSLLNIRPVMHVRRNHALEHATIHLLSAKYRRTALVGRSTHRGFWIYGDVDTDDVEMAVNEAMRRLRRGEHELALHPNCGTSIITTGVLTGLTGFLALLGAKRLPEKLERLPAAVMLATAAVILSQPLGLSIQRYITTSGEIGDLRVVRIRRFMQGPIVAHYIETESS